MICIRPFLRPSVCSRNQLVSLGLDGLCALSPYSYAVSVVLSLIHLSRGSAKSLSFFPLSTSSCLNSKNEGQTCLVQSAEIKVLGKFLTCQYFELPVESP